ncbi:MAG: rhomboid family intramembrane serine protease [Nanobdellota archaeon]
MRIRNAVLPLIGINVFIFLLQSAIPGFNELFVLTKGSLFTEPWRIITSMFMHANFTHILFNMYALFIFGPLVEQKVGTKKFLQAYFTAGILAGIVSSFIYSSALGASGAIMGIIGMVIILFPHLQVLLFFVVPMSMRVAGIIFALIEIFGLFVPSGIANMAHLVGLATGILFSLRFSKSKGGSGKRYKGLDLTRSQDEIDAYFRYK